MTSTAQGEAPAKTKTAGPAAASAPTPRRTTMRTTTLKTRSVGPEQRRNYIEVAAYYIAERRGFSEGHETDDWTAAEMEIDRLLEEGKLSG